MSAREKAMDRVRKLLALARGKGATAGEAAAAAAAAQKIMLEYDIEEALLGDEDAGEEEWVDGDLLDEEPKAAHWKGILASALAKMNGAFCYLAVRSRGGKNGIRIVGRASDAQRVRYLYEWLADEIWRITLAETPQWNTLRYHYALGITETVVARLYEAKLRAEARARGAHTGTALIKIGDALAKREERSDEAKARAGPLRDASEPRDSAARTMGNLRGMTVKLPEGEAPALGAGKKELGRRREGNG